MLNVVDSAVKNPMLSGEINYLLSVDNPSPDRPHFFLGKNNSSSPFAFGLSILLHLVEMVNFVRPREYVTLPIPHAKWTVARMKCLNTIRELTHNKFRSETMGSYKFPLSVYFYNKFSVTFRHSATKPDPTAVRIGCLVYLRPEPLNRVHCPTITRTMLSMRSIWNEGLATPSALHGWAFRSKQTTGQRAVFSFLGPGRRDLKDFRTNNASYFHTFSPL